MPQIKGCIGQFQIPVPFWLLVILYSRIPCFLRKGMFIRFFNSEAGRSIGWKLHDAMEKMAIWLPG